MTVTARLLAKDVFQSRCDYGAKRSVFKRATSEVVIRMTNSVTNRAERKPVTEMSSLHVPIKCDHFCYLFHQHRLLFAFFPHPCSNNPPCTSHSTSLFHFHNFASWLRKLLSSTLRRATPLPTESMPSSTA